MKDIKSTDDLLNKKQKDILKALEAIEHISEGCIPNVACKRAGITRKRLYSLADSDATIRKKLDEAERSGDENLVDDLLNVEAWQKYGVEPGDSKTAHVWASNAKWVLSKRRAEKYSDKVVIEQKTTMDVVITTRLENAKKRSTEFLNSLALNGNTEYQPPLLEIADAHFDSEE